MRPLVAFYRSLFGRAVTIQEIDGSNLSLDLTREDHLATIKLTISTKRSAILSVLSRSAVIPRAPVLKIEGLTFSTHDRAVTLLEKIANSLLFQIDLNYNTPLGLRKSRRMRPASRRPAKDRKELEFPLHEYDDAPIALYWYARSATQMPLLQYLAYYQTIEFYFPSYAEAEARREVRVILKDPTFRPDHDADMGILLSSMRITPGFYGDERTQLRTTLNACLSAEELRSYLEVDDARKKFFSSKTKGLTDQRVALNTPSADLRNDVADRIYDIRCKIVHTKGLAVEGKVDLLLPFSKEAELLYADIDLIQYVARQVLIAASSTLSL